MHLLDSNILIYGSKPGNEFMDEWLLPDAANLSAISIPEVLGFPGLTTEDEAMFEALFANLHLHEVSITILRKAAELRRNRRMKLGDSIVAATALTIGADLVTRNVDDFKHLAGMRIINPFEPPQAS